MYRLLPPLCLFLAIAMVIAGFALWSIDAPEASMELHRARVDADEQMREVLESRLQRKRFQRNLLLTSLFVGAGVMIVAAFWTMRPAEAQG